jgi:hypothetical protein
MVEKSILVGAVSNHGGLCAKVNNFAHINDFRRTIREHRGAGADDMVGRETV